MPLKFDLGEENLILSYKKSKYLKTLLIKKLHNTYIYNDFKFYSRNTITVGPKAIPVLISLKYAWKDLNFHLVNGGQTSIFRYQEMWATIDHFRALEEGYCSIFYLIHAIYR